LGRLTYGLRWLWIVVGVLVLSVGISYGINVFANLKTGGLDDTSAGSSKEAQLMLQSFPRSRVSLILLAKNPLGTIDQPSFRSAFQNLISAVETDSSKPSVTSYYTTGSPSFVSNDKKETFALIGVSGDQDSAYLRIKHLLSNASIPVQLGGPAASDYELNAEVARDLPKLGAISLPLLLILLLLIFRSPIAASLPLLIGAISVLGAFAITRIMTSFMDISVFAANIISLLGLGLAIDYSLLYVSRFRDELDAGQSVESAIRTSSTHAGAAIFLSGTTVALSLLGLLAFPQMFLRSMGVGGAVAVASAVAASLTILPAILSVIGKNVNRLMIPVPISRNLNRKSAWRTFGTFVVHWPVSVLFVTLGALFLAGSPFLHVKFANPGVDTLPSFFQSRQVADSITKDFPHSENPEIEILLTLPESPISSDGLATVISYANQLRELQNVVSVGGLTTPVSSRSESQLSAFYSQTANPEVQQIEKLYVSGSTTLLTLSYKGGSDDLSTQALVRAVRGVPIPDNSSVLVGGQTAELVDNLDSLGSHMPTAIAIIFATTFVVLLVMLSSVVIPIKAIILNTLSLSAAFGLMTWIFQEGHLHKLLQFTSSGSLDPTLPVLIFAIAFGLATDYEVFLVSRIKEEFDRTHDNTEAVIIGVEKTGGVITSAGLLLVVVVAAFGMSDILSMKEMGVGLAIAVAVDAAIVRTLLVPAAMQLFGPLNWWMPGKGELLEME